MVGFTVFLAGLRTDYCSLPHILIVKPACAAQFLGVRLAVAT
jgi:hypothetical protein